MARLVARRGRPARLSREAIVEAALELLRRAPDEPLTVARIAREVDAVPAALYRHFASLDELLDAVLGSVLGAVTLDIRRRASWPEQVRDWMTSLRAHLMRYPAVVHLIGRRGRTSPAWLDAVAVLVEILQRGGLAGAKLARAHLWIVETTIAVVVQEAFMAVPEQIAGARAALDEMSDEGRARLRPLMPHLEATSGDQLFAFVADRTIAGLVDLVRKR
ncbi:MAG: helix-turn-helix domain-containing protein [Thermodesulfobacteriota bacterium]